MQTLRMILFESVGLFRDVIVLPIGGDFMGESLGLRYTSEQGSFSAWRLGHHK